METRQAPGRSPTAGRPASPRRSPDAPRLITWPAGAVLWRVTRDVNGMAFSARPDRLGRFSPVRAPDGSIVPAWYGATSPAGAISESVFHDVRPSDAAPRVMPNAYGERVLVPVMTVRDLTLVDLTSTGLHAIGISRAALLESTSARHRWTIGIAERLRAAAPAADGFAWVSRAHDTSQAVVLYADEGRALMIAPDAEPVALALGLGGGLNLLRELAVAARITLVVPGR